MQNPIASSKREAESVALAAAQAGWATTIRYAVIIVLTRGVPWAVVLAAASAATGVIR